MKPGEYQCALCKGIFQSARSEQEAIAEKERDFGDLPMDRCVVVCDGCYREYMSPLLHPDLYAAWKASRN